MFCTGCCVSDEPAAVVPVDGGLGDPSIDLLPSAPAVTKRHEVPEESSAASTLVITIDKQAADTPVGMHLDLSDSSLVHVCGLREGSSPVAAYNETVGKDLQLGTGDYISRVNAVSNNAKKMVEEIQRSSTLQLEVRRPIVMQAKIDKRDGPMGLELNYAMSGTSLVIDGIVEGAVKAFNLENPDKELRKGDRILAVDGKTGTAAELLQFISKSNPVAFELSRPAGM